MVAHYFDNLLPDNPRIRERNARRFKLRAGDAFTLLQAIGRDCVGAVLLLPLGLAGGSRRVDLNDSVANEWLCAQVLHHWGLPVARTEMWRFEDQQAARFRAGLAGLPQA